MVDRGKAALALLGVAVTRGVLPKPGVIVGVPCGAGVGSFEPVPPADARGLIHFRRRVLCGCVLPCRGLFLGWLLRR